MQSTVERLGVAKTTFYEHLAPRIQRIRQGAMDAANAGLGSRQITVNQFELLAAAYLLEDADQQSVARALGIDPSSTMALVDKLEAAGLLRREVSLDRRRRIARLTSEGTVLVDEEIGDVLKAGDGALAALGDGKRAFLSSLKTLIEQPSNAPAYDRDIIERHAERNPAVAALFKGPIFLARRALQIANALLSAEGADGMEYTILDLVSRGLITDQAELTRATRISRSSSLPALNRLEKRRCLFRQVSETDARRRIFRLTSEGEAILPRLRQAERDYETRFLSVLPPEEQQRFLGQLRLLLRVD